MLNKYFLSLSFGCFRLLTFYSLLRLLYLLLPILLFTCVFRIVFIKTTRNCDIHFLVTVMPFTTEQDTFLLMAHFRSGVQALDGQWTYSMQSCINQFTAEYPDEHVAYDTFVQHVNRLAKRFMETGSILKRKRESRPTVLTQETVANIENRIQVSPHKSIRKLSAQAGVSYGSVRTTLRKHLQMHPYKISVLQQLYPHDIEQRTEYCQWFNNAINNDDILDLTFFSDEAWFHLSGYVNSQNYRTWSSDNPHEFRETTLHPIKLRVWIAMSRRRIIGPIFFQDTINAVRYRELILEPNNVILHVKYSVLK